MTKGNSGSNNNPKVKTEKNTSTVRGVVKAISKFTSRRTSIAATNDTNTDTQQNHVSSKLKSKPPTELKGSNVASSFTGAARKVNPSSDLTSGPSTNVSELNSTNKKVSTTNSLLNSTVVPYDISTNSVTNDVRHDIITNLVNNDQNGTGTPTTQVDKKLGTNSNSTTNSGSNVKAVTHASSSPVTNVTNVNKTNDTKQVVSQVVSLPPAIDAAQSTSESQLVATNNISDTFHLSDVLPTNEQTASVIPEVEANPEEVAVIAPQKPPGNPSPRPHYVARVITNSVNPDNRETIHHAVKASSTTSIETDENQMNEWLLYYSQAATQNLQPKDGSKPQPVVIPIDGSNNVSIEEYEVIFDKNKALPKGQKAKERKIIANGAEKVIGEHARAFKIMVADDQEYTLISEEKILEQTTETTVEKILEQTTETTVKKRITEVTLTPADQNDETLKALALLGRAKMLTDSLGHNLVRSYLSQDLISRNEESFTFPKLSNSTTQYDIEVINHRAKNPLARIVIEAVAKAKNAQALSSALAHANEFQESVYSSLKGAYDISLFSKSTEVERQFALIDAIKNLKGNSNNNKYNIELDALRDAISKVSSETITNEDLEIAIDYPIEDFSAKGELADAITLAQKLPLGTDFNTNKRNVLKALNYSDYTLKAQQKLNNEGGETGAIQQYRIAGSQIQKKISENLWSELKLESDPVLSILQDNIKELNKSSVLIQKHLRGSLVRSIKKEGRDLKAALEAAAEDIFGPNKENSEAYKNEAGEFKFALTRENPSEAKKIKKDKEGKEETKYDISNSKTTFDLKIGDFKDYLVFGDTVISNEKTTRTSSDLLSIYETQPNEKNERKTKSDIPNFHPEVTYFTYKKGLPTINYSENNVTQSIDIDLERFLEERRNAESKSLYDELSQFLQKSGHESNIAEAYRNYVKYENGKIFLINKQEGVPSVTVVKKGNDYIYSASVSYESENDPAANDQSKNFSDSKQIWALIEARKSLKQIAAEVEKQKSGDLLKAEKKLFDAFNIVSKDISGNDQPHDYERNGANKFKKTTEAGTKQTTFEFEEKKFEFSEDGKLVDSNKSIKDLIQDEANLKAFLTQEIAAHSATLKTTFEEITGNRNNNEKYVSIEEIEGMEKVTLRPLNVDQVKNLSLSCKFSSKDNALQATVITYHGEPESKELHKIIKAQELAEVITKVIALDSAKDHFEDIFFQVVDSGKENALKTYKFLGTPEYTFNDEVTKQKITSGNSSVIYDGTDSPTLESVIYNENSGSTTLETEKKYVSMKEVTAELNKLSALYQQKIVEEKKRIIPLIQKNLGVLLGANDQIEIDNETQKISRILGDNELSTLTITNKQKDGQPEKSTIYQLNSDNEVLSVNGQKPTLARLDELMNQLQQNNVKSLYDKASALAPYGAIELDNTNSITVKPLAKEPDTLEIIRPSKETVYLKEDVLFDLSGKKLSISPELKANLEAATTALHAEQAKFREVANKLKNKATRKDNADYQSSTNSAPSISNEGETFIVQLENKSYSFQNKTGAEGAIKFGGTETLVPFTDLKDANKVVTDFIKEEERRLNEETAEVVTKIATEVVAKVSSAAVFTKPKNTRNHASHDESGARDTSHDESGARDTSHDESGARDVESRILDTNKRNEAAVKLLETLKKVSSNIFGDHEGTSFEYKGNNNNKFSKKTGTRKNKHGDEDEDEYTIYNFEISGKEYEFKFSEDLGLIIEKKISSKELSEAEEVLQNFLTQEKKAQSEELKKIVDGITQKEEGGKYQNREYVNIEKNNDVTIITLTDGNNLCLNYKFEGSDSASVKLTNREDYSDSICSIKIAKEIAKKIEQEIEQKKVRTDQEVEQQEKAQSDEGAKQAAKSANRLHAHAVGTDFYSTGEKEKVYTNLRGERDKQFQTTSLHRALDKLLETDLIIKSADFPNDKAMLEEKRALNIGDKSKLIQHAADLLEQSGKKISNLSSGEQKLLEFATKKYQAIEHLVVNQKQFLKDAIEVVKEHYKADSEALLELQKQIPHSNQEIAGKDDRYDKVKENLDKINPKPPSTIRLRSAKRVKIEEVLQQTRQP